MRGKSRKKLHGKHSQHTTSYNYSTNVVLETVVHLTNFHAEENPIGCAPKLKSGKGGRHLGDEKTKRGIDMAYGQIDKMGI